MSRDLRIRVRTIGSEGARAAIRGVTREAQQGAVRQRQASRGRVTEEQRASREIARVHQQMERGRLRETERSARSQTRAVEREARQQRRAQEREAAATARAQARAAEQRRRGLRALPGAVGTAALAAGDAVVGRARGYQSSLGIQSRDQLVAGFVDRQERLIRLSANSGLGTDVLQSTISQASQGALTSQDDILSALETAQASLVGGNVDLQHFVDNVERFSRASRAAGGSTEDWTIAVGQMERQLNVSASDSEELVGVLVAAARAGAIEAGDFAQQFSGILSQFRVLRGDQGTGIGGAREFGAVAQALGQGGQNPAEVRTLMANLVRGLSRGQTQRGIERALGDRNVFDQQGRLTIDIGELVQRMAADSDFRSAAGRERIFGRDAEFNSAIVGLMERSNDPNFSTIGELQSVNAQEGQQVVNDFFSQLNASTAGEVLGIRSRAEAQFATNGGDLVSHEARLAAALTDVETRFPLATEAVGTLRDVVTATTAAFGALNLAMGGGAAAAAAGAAGTGAAGAAGTGLVAAGALATGGVALGGAAAILGYASSAGGDVSPEQVAAQQQRRDAMLSGSALTAMASLPSSVSRGEVGRRAREQFAATGRQLTDEDVRAIAEAVRTGAAQGVAQGASGAARDARTQAGRTASQTR